MRERNTLLAWSPGWPRSFIICLYFKLWFLPTVTVDCVVEYCLDSVIRAAALARPTASFTDSRWLSLVNCQQSFCGVSFPFIELFHYSMSCSSTSMLFVCLVCYLVLTWFTGGRWWCYSDNFLTIFHFRPCLTEWRSRAAWTGSGSFILYSQNNELKDTKPLCSTEASGRVEVTVRSWFTTSHITLSFDLLLTTYCLVCVVHAAAAIISCAPTWACTRAELRFINTLPVGIYQT